MKSNFDLAGAALILCLFSTANIQGAAPQPGQHAESFDVEIRRQIHLDYWLYLPKDYNEVPTKKWPMILFLHGAGERGSNLEVVKKHGPAKLITQGKQFPFIIASPQCPTGDWWSSTAQVEALKALLDQLVKDYRVDVDRVYLTGLSMGGYGTWALSAAYPEMFAAIAPICGGGEPRRARMLKDTPVWVFHGAKDSVVPIKESEEMVEALKRIGADVQFTVYPDANHDSWTITYENPKLFEWFLTHSR